jgi:hypothetical protein
MASLNCLKKASYFSLPFAAAKRRGLTRSTRISVALGLDDFDGLGKKVLEGHGTGIGGLAGAYELSLDVGWDEFEDFHVGRLELVTQGLGVGVDSGLGGVVRGGDGHRNEGQTGGHGDDGGVGLLQEVRKQRGGEADWAEEVGGDGGLGVGDVCGLGKDVFGAHDAGVVDDDVEGREVGGV